MYGCVEDECRKLMVCFGGASEGIRWAVGWLRSAVVPGDEV